MYSIYFTAHQICSSLYVEYTDFINRSNILTTKLLSQGYQNDWIAAKICCGRYIDLFGIFGMCHSFLMIYYNVLYRLWPILEYDQILIMIKYCETQIYDHDCDNYPFRQLQVALVW